MLHQLLLLALGRLKLNLSCHTADTAEGALGCRRRLQGTVLAQGKRWLVDGDS